MYRAELHLSNYEKLRLDEFRFFHPDNPKPLVTVNGGSPSYCVGSSRNLFNWTVGVRALTLLLLKSALGEERAMISGGARTPAATLDYALSKEPEWLIDFFGMTSQGTAVARSILGRRNTERKRPGPVEIYLNDRLLPPSAISIFVNGAQLSPNQIEPLIASLQYDVGSAQAKSCDRPARVDENEEVPGEEDFPLSARRRSLVQSIDFVARKARISFHSCYRNTSNRPVTFVHYNVYRDLPNGPENIQVKCPTESNVRCEEVIDSYGKKRMLVTFSRPLLPGEEREETLSYEVNNFTSLDSHLSHLVTLPTEELSLEMSCTNRSHHIVSSAMVAEKEDAFVFSTLPKLVRKNSKSGASILRWTMKNPPQGFRFRLMWGIEVRAEKDVELPLNSAIPATLN